MIEPVSRVYIKNLVKMTMKESSPSHRDIYEWELCDRVGREIHGELINTLHGLKNNILDTLINRSLENDYV